MGNRCCAERRGVVVDNKKMGDENLSKPERKNRASCAAQDASKSRAQSIGFRGHGPDAAKFDKAFESNDIKTMVELLDSDEKINKFDEKLHPWADDPTTVSALTAMQLTILATTTEGQDIQQKIISMGAVPKLAKCIKSTKPDMVQAAVIALSAITSECPEGAMAAFSAGVVGPLVGILKTSTILGMRSTIATTLRDMFVESMEARLQFMQEGGTALLVNQASATCDDPANQSDSDLEAVLNIQDYLEDEDGNIIPQIAQDLIKFKVKEALKNVGLRTNDQEVRDSTEELLALLHDYN